MGEKVNQADLVDAPPRPSVAHADGPDGLRLPLIEIDHPDFRVALDPQALDRLGEAFVAEQTRAENSLVGRLFNRFVLPRLLRSSRVGRGLVRARGEVLDGLTTYLLKLVPGQLGAPWASDGSAQLDRDRRARADAEHRLLAEAGEVLTGPTQTHHG